MYNNKYEIKEKVKNQIKEKLKNSGATISKADKCNSIMIIYQVKYNEKIRNSITINNFTTTTGNLTKKSSKDSRKNVNEFKLIMHNDDKWKYINLKTSPPTNRGLIKIYKTESPH
jgi:hypothetical protein